MKILKWILGGVVALVLLFVALLYATGNSALLTFGWGFLFGGPPLPFDEREAVAAPDYADQRNWAALPETAGPEDMTPAGVDNAVVQGRAPADVFFIHPTGYLQSSTWTFSLDPNTATEENTQWMMANQASAYNGCCNVYAPRYRQASIFAYFKGDDVREQVLGFAYRDVARAFDYFLAHHSNGRPFVIASHSQGTHHGARLLKEKIDGTPLSQRLVAAYIIGGGISNSHFDDMRDIRVCGGPTELHCAVHWDTYSEVAINEDMAGLAGNVCVNPLTWLRDGGLADRSLHEGAVPGSGEFQIALSGDDVPTGVVFDPLVEPLRNLLEAQCRNGVLFITDQTDSPLASSSFGGGNYHGLDYPAFHMDIRHNAAARVAVYLAHYERQRAGSPGDRATRPAPAAGDQG